MSETIPGRRVSAGDTLYTDWTQRRGDSLLLRVEGIVSSGGAAEFELQTRAEPGPSNTGASEVFPLTPTFLSNGSGTKLEVNAVGVFTALYRATTDGDTGGDPDSMQAFVRLKITYDGSSGDYQVVRVLPFTFFDNAKP